MRMMAGLTLLAVGLACGGCASVTDMKALDQKATGLEKQVAALEQRGAAEEKAIAGLTAELAGARKTLEQLQQQADNQAKTNRRLEAMLAQRTERTGDSAMQPPEGRPGAGRDRGVEWRERQFAQVSEALKLTDDQKEKVKAVMTEAAESMRKTITEMREAGGEIDRDKMRKAMEDLRARNTETMKTLLTPEQMEEYKKLEERMMNRGPMGERGRRGGEGGNRQGHDEATSPARAPESPPAAK